MAGANAEWPLWYADHLASMSPLAMACVAHLWRPATLGGRGTPAG